MKNNLIIITCHCNNEEKIQVLEENINLLKSIDLDIMLVSHVPVPFDIQSQVEYVIYDKSNPIIDFPYRGMVFWRTMNFNGTIIRFDNILSDYGWTAFNQYLLGGNLGLSLNYNFYSFINYDVKLTNLMLDSFQTPSDFLVSNVVDNNDEKGYRFPSFMLNILSKKNLKSILPIIDKKYYMSDTHPWLKGGKFRDAEDYWGHLITNYQYDVFSEPIEDQISFDNTGELYNFSKHEEFKIFFQNSNTHERFITESRIPRVIIYENSTSFLTLVINDLHTNIIDGANILLDLPEVTSIGYIYEGEYYDLTEEYNNSIYSTINYI